MRTPGVCACAYVNQVLAIQNSTSKIEDDFFSRDRSSITSYMGGEGDNGGGGGGVAQRILLLQRHFVTFHKIYRGR